MHRTSSALLVELQHGLKAQYTGGKKNGTVLALKLPDITTLRLKLHTHVTPYNTYLHAK